MEIINHKIGESFTLLVDNTEVISYRVSRSVDGKYFNKERQLFETWDQNNISKYLFTLYMSTAQGLKVSKVNYIPKMQQDLVFEFLNTENIIVYRERHLFGGMFDETKPDVCVIYGTIYDPSGRPIPNARVEASLVKNGYFIDKVPILGPTATAVTDDRGYFELPLIQGINVSITISAIGFSTSGYVPKAASVALNGYCLLREGYGNH